MEKTMVCSVCNGEMKQFVGPRHSRKMGGFLMGAGVLSTLFWVGPVLGLPLLVMGGYMSAAKRNLWVCGDCQSAIERLDVKVQPRVAAGKQTAKAEKVAQ